MKLHWFSPLPPARTGIAEYSAMLAPWLGRDADSGIQTHGWVRHYYRPHVVKTLLDFARL